MVALPPKQAEARAEAARDFLTFEGAPADRPYPGQTDAENQEVSAEQSAPGAAGFGINTPFAETVIGGRYCYDGLRANFVGPRISGVILMALGTSDDGSTLMRMEARPQPLACADLEPDWRFTGAETVFYR